MILILVGANGERSFSLPRRVKISNELYGELKVAVGAKAFAGVTDEVDSGRESAGGDPGIDMPRGDSDGSRLHIV